MRSDLQRFPNDMIGTAAGALAARNLPLVCEHRKRRSIFMMDVSSMCLSISRSRLSKSERSASVIAESSNSPLHGAGGTGIRLRFLARPADSELNPVCYVPHIPIAACTANREHRDVNTHRSHQRSQ